MATVDTQRAGLSPFTESSQYNWLQRTLLKTSHPVSIIFYLIGWTWGIFYLWHNQWLSALTAVVVARFLGYFAVRHAHVDAMAKTKLGKLALLHANPSNLLTQLAGGIILLGGVWLHRTDIILTGTSLIAFGHLFGWSKVDASLELQESK